MSRRRNKLTSAIGPGRGHTAKTILADPVQVYLPPALLAGMEPGTRAFVLGECSVFVSWSSSGWHMSIAHPSRYPTWDEVAKARYSLMPADITVAMLLPPQTEYVNIHANCFQLWQVLDRRVVGQPVALGVQDAAPAVTVIAPAADFERGLSPI